MNAAAAAGAAGASAASANEGEGDDDTPNNVSSVANNDDDDGDDDDGEAEGGAEGANEILFLTVEWPSMADILARAGLRRPDFHITIAFTQRDAHAPEISKGADAIVDAV